MSESKSRLEKVNYMFERALETAQDSPMDLINLLASDAKFVWRSRGDGVEDITQQEFYNLYIQETSGLVPQEIIETLFKLYKLAEDEKHAYAHLFLSIRESVKIRTRITIDGNIKRKKFSILYTRPLMALMRRCLRKSILQNRHRQFCWGRKERSIRLA